MRVVWHAEAEQEFIQAAEFYDARVPGLGAAFIEAVDGTVAQIAEDPERFPTVDEDLQRARVSRFPYCVYFRRLADSLRILVVRHHSRHPDYWKNRR